MMENRLANGLVIFLIVPKVNLITARCNLIDGTHKASEHAIVNFFLAWAPADIPTVKQLLHK